MNIKDPETALAYQIRIEGLPMPEREYRFAKPRKFRADFAWPELRLLVEVEGATWTNGRHTRGAGYKNDCIKYNLAASLGYTVLRYTSDMVMKGDAILQIKEFIHRRAA